MAPTRSAVDRECEVGTRYTVLPEREPDAGSVATVPVLPGCVSQGNSREEALRNIQEAVELYVEDCRAADDRGPQGADRDSVAALPCPLRHLRKTLEKMTLVPQDLLRERFMDAILRLSNRTAVVSMLSGGNRT